MSAKAQTWETVTMPARTANDYRQVQQLRARTARRAIVYNRPLADKPRERWVENAAPSLRFVGYADELNPAIKHKGRYLRSDDYGGEVARGVVYQLPSRQGLVLFAYGVADPCNENCALLDFDLETAPANDVDAIDYAKRGAASYADSVAERYAETEREWNDAWDMGCVVADRQRGIAYEWQRVREVCAELRAISRGTWKRPDYVPLSAVSIDAETREAFLRNDWLPQSLRQLCDDREWCRAMMDEYGHLDAFKEGLQAG